MIIVLILKKTINSLLSEVKKKVSLNKDTKISGDNSSFNIKKNKDKARLGLFQNYICCQLFRVGQPEGLASFNFEKIKNTKPTELYVSKPEEVNDHKRLEVTNFVPMVRKEKK